MVGLQPKSCAMGIMATLMLTLSCGEARQGDGRWAGGWVGWARWGVGGGSAETGVQSCACASSATWLAVRPPLARRGADPRQVCVVAGPGRPRRRPVPGVRGGTCPATRGAYPRLVCAVARARPPAAPTRARRAGKQLTHHVADHKAEAGGGHDSILGRHRLPLPLQPEALAGIPARRIARLLLLLLLFGRRRAAAKGGRLRLRRLRRQARRRRKRPPSCGAARRAPRALRIAALSLLLAPRRPRPPRRHRPVRAHQEAG